MNRIPIFLKVLFAVSVSCIPFAASAQERPVQSSCSYEMRVWNVKLRNSGPIVKVNHTYKELTPDEVDPVSGCTVCTEDQSRITIPPLAPFFICYKFASAIQSVMKNLIEKDQSIYTVEGYRVIKSSGPVDHNGNRTGFSNHSFGTAIDINPELNGLYENCVAFNPDCRLLRGGEWRPGVPGALEKNSDIVRNLKQVGFLWGGEIAGRQKDFMHFSLTGY
jgi:hypothetical protein